MAVPYFFLVASYAFICSYIRAIELTKPNPTLEIDNMDATVQMLQMLRERVEQVCKSLNETAPGSDPGRKSEDALADELHIERPTDSIVLGLFSEVERLEQCVRSLPHFIPRYRQFCFVKINNSGDSEIENAYAMGLMPIDHSLGTFVDKHGLHDNDLVFGTGNFADSAIYDVDGEWDIDMEYVNGPWPGGMRLSAWAGLSKAQTDMYVRLVSVCMDGYQPHINQSMLCLEDLAGGAAFTVASASQSKPIIVGMKCDIHFELQRDSKLLDAIRATSDDEARSFSASFTTMMTTKRGTIGVVVPSMITSGEDLSMLWTKYTTD